MIVRSSPTEFKTQFQMSLRLAFFAWTSSFACLVAAEEFSSEAQSQEFTAETEFVEALSEPSRSGSFTATTVIGEFAAGPVSGVELNGYLGIDPEKDVSRLNSNQIFGDGFE